jgi:hypothetical protein
MAGGFRMELVRIGCIEIDKSLRSPREGPERTRNIAISLSKYMLSSTYRASE